MIEVEETLGAFIMTLKDMESSIRKVRQQYEHCLRKVVAQRILREAGESD